MKRHLTAALFALTGCALIAIAQAANWKEYQYAEDGFAITVPSEPVLQKQSTDTNLGKLETNNYQVDLGNNSGFIVAVTDYHNATATVSAKERLQMAKNGSAKAVNGKVISEQEISIAGNPGLQFEVEAEQYHARARYFLVNSRLLALMSIAPAGQPFSPHTDKIFNSLRLLKPKS